MGEVFLAEDTRLNRRVALKILPARFTEDRDRLHRFEQEARAASALNHPNIITIFEIGQFDLVHFIATEFIEGCTIRERLEDGPLPLSDSLDIAVQAASALQAAHAGGIIHRDIKPENIMLRPDGYIKVLDFGLAKLTEVRNAECGMQNEENIPHSALRTLHFQTRPGTVMGTVSYMSPEQARGFDIDHRTDIFSLGIVLYEMIAGRLPFSGETASDVMAAILRSEPLPLAHHSPSIPMELEAIVALMLRKNCDERCRSATEALGELKRIRQRVEFEAELERSGSTIIAAAPMDSDKSSGARRAEQTSPRKTRVRKAIDSLAVLPITNVGSDPGAEYLSDGITESIINSLSQLPKLRVVPRSTVFRYKGSETDPQEVGRELGVRAVLTGRLLQMGDRLVINTELIDVAQQSQLWGEQYRRQMIDIFDLQEELSNDISEKLRLKLTGEEKKKLVKRYTDNTAAYHLYLKGRYYNNKRTEEWIRKGIEHFQQAIELDPNYALAYAGLADSYAFLASSTGGWEPGEAYPKAKAAALKALAIDDDLAEAHTSLGFSWLLYDWDFEEAERRFKRALELNPNYANAHDGLAFYFKAAGRHEEAIAECRKSAEIDPLSLFAIVSLGWGYYFAGRFDEAIAQDRKALEMDPNFYFAYWNLGLSLLQKGRTEEAVEALRDGVVLSGGVIAFYAHFGYGCAMAGKRDEAEKVFAELERISRTGYVSSYYFAIIQMALGNHDHAFEYLEKAFEERAGFLAFLKVEPILDPLRSDARFEELMRRIIRG
jgi:serine/threonine protein kinase/Flp pilus assembly protein TadD